MAGRPRGVDDEVILRAAADVIGRVGPAKLTLSLVAREVGLVPGTLVQRFGSKRGLLLAVAEHSVKDPEAVLRQVRDRHASALAAVEALVTRQMVGMATPEVFANHLAFLCIDLTDPEFHEHALAVHRAQGQAIESLLAEAVSAGELRAGTDVAALAATVQAIAAGAGLTWALERAGALDERLRKEIRGVLAPHVPATPDLEEA
ncbi:TetR/AcrR family transcriptional regulator [Microtetraspora malaysiensis]|uniref:TetR/AcrR family transcriptional regulator n=1 Tax=Microtetraspora malaysiensis TaxID=161358 RepID=UPI003D8B295E